MEEKVKLNKSRYKELKKLLISKSDEDFTIGCETIKNIEISNIAITLFAKCLAYGRRTAFMEMFKDKISETVNGKLNSMDDINSIDLSWEVLFPAITNNHELTEFDKDLITSEIEDLVSTTLKNLDYKFIKNLNLNLKW